MGGDEGSVQAGRQEAVTDKVRIPPRFPRILTRPGTAPPAQGLDPLYGDYQATRDRLLEHDTQTERRTLVRAIFVLIEGQVADRKYNFYAYARKGWAHLNEGEMLFLRERAYEINDKGAVVPQQRFIRLDVNVLFTLAMCGRLTGEVLEVDRQGAGWQAFRKAIKIRNRITHPKSEEDCFVSNEDLQVIEDTHEWFTGLTGLWPEITRSFGNWFARRGAEVYRVDRPAALTRPAQDAKESPTTYSTAEGDVDVYSLEDGRWWRRAAADNDVLNGPFKDAVQAMQDAEVRLWVQPSDRRWEQVPRQRDFTIVYDGGHWERGGRWERGEFDRLIDLVTDFRLPRYGGTLRGNSERVVLELRDPEKGHTLHEEGDAKTVRERFSAWLSEAYKMEPPAPFPWQQEIDLSPPVADLPPEPGEGEG
jgi:hypothetical protein